MSPSFADRAWTGVRWLAPATFFALAPKCVVCVLAYAGLGAALGAGGTELCGGPAAPSSTVAVTLGGAVIAIATWTALGFRRSRRRP